MLLTIKKKNKINSRYVNPLSISISDLDMVLCELWGTAHRICRILHENLVNSVCRSDTFCMLFSMLNNQGPVMLQPPSILSQWVQIHRTLTLKACPHWQLATIVANFGDCRRKRRPPAKMAPFSVTMTVVEFSATVAIFCDSHRIRRQCGQGFRVLLIVLQKTNLIYLSADSWLTISNRA